MTTDDLDLLRQFSRDHRQDAFTALVQRHLNLVYSAALRQVRSPQLAEEVAQSVFADLARDAARLQPDTVLTAWLYAVTRRTAIDVIRKESRRQLREQLAAQMNALNATDAAWPDLEPHLDEAMAALDESDRTALLLRYFENKSLREVGQQLGISDDTAQKRVSRAVDRLREIFAQRKITIGVSGLILLISANAIQAAPAALATAITQGVLTSSAMTSAALAKTSAATSFTKAGILSIATLTAVTAALIVGHVRHQTSPLATSGLSSSTFQQNVQTAAAAPPLSQATTNSTRWLSVVVQARQRITSGVMEFQYLRERTTRNGFPETDQSRFVTTFDGPKLRFDSYGTEYAYAFDNDEAKQAEIVRRADSMAREDAIKAGLTQPFSSQHAFVHDGDTLMDLWFAGNQQPSMTISATSEGAHTYTFDPRCLGFSHYLPVDCQIGQWFKTGPQELVGEETLDGIPAIHLRIASPNEAPQEYWVDKAHPERLLQYSYGNDLVKSRYNNDDPRDPLPVEVDSTTYSQGKLIWHSKLSRVSARYNVPVEPSTFSLPGLNIPVGTPVNDDRIQRRIGYWTGQGLSENFDGRKDTNAAVGPSLAESLTSLQNDPQSPEALSNSIAIILNNPDGPAVKQAADVILQYHTHDTNLVDLCRELDRVRPASTTNLLMAFLQDNPSLDVQGHACLTLAGLWKDQANYGQNPEATAQAIQYYQRLIKDFSTVHERGYGLDELARPELNELQNLVIGKPAPETVGVDMNGQPLDLKSYRGQVVALVFWSEPFTEVYKINQTRDELADKPFALLGVNCEYDWQIQKSSLTNLTWPSFRDGRDGPIAKAWHNNSWTDIWVLDRNGIIRYRGIREWDIKPSVEKLLKE